MTNPPPRPALRKAPDADVHPVAARPDTPEQVSAPAQLRPVVGLGGRTSDTLLKSSKKAKRTALEVKVPKAVLKSAKSRAKKRGDALDDVVSAALQAYAEQP